MRSFEFQETFSGLIALMALIALPSLAAAQNTTRVPATVQAYESAELYSRIGGYLKSVAVDIGDDVIKGQPLAVIDVPEMEMQLLQKKSLYALAEAETAQAKAKIDEASSMLEALQASVQEAQTMMAQKQALYQFEMNERERIAKLVMKGAISRDLLDAANYKLKAAESEQLSVIAKVATANAKLSGGKAGVRRAEADAAAAAAQIDVAKAGIKYTSQMLKYATIRAPWDGKVTARMYDAGSFLQSAEGNSAAKPIFKLVRDEEVRVVFSVSQKDLAGLKRGIKVTLGSIDALPDQTFEGTVSRFAAELDPATRMMRVEMDLDNADGKLKSGFFGYATIHFE